MRQGIPLCTPRAPELDISTLHADPRYQPDYKSVAVAPYTFLSGGTRNGHYYQRSTTWDGKFDITSQWTSNHEVKLGAEFRKHGLYYDSFTVLRDTVRYFEATIPRTNTVYHDTYSRKPTEVSAYIQDKMEFESLILNVGLRYDYFTSDADYSTDVFYPSPNNPSLPSTVDPSTLLAHAKGKHQWSPRVGVSFPITDKGIIHFSYGHFFQMPPFSYLYANPDFKYSFSSGTPTFRQRRSESAADRDVRARSAAAADGQPVIQRDGVLQGRARSARTAADPHQRGRDLLQIRQQGLQQRQGAHLLADQAPRTGRSRRGDAGLYVPGC